MHSSPFSMLCFESNENFFFAFTLKLLHRIQTITKVSNIDLPFAFNAFQAICGNPLECLNGLK